MKTIIIISKKDPASMNIYSLLKNENLEKYNTKIHLVEKESIFCEKLDKQIQADLFIFATKHESESKIPSLCVHSPGNWSKAELGGQDRKLCIAPALHLRSAFLKLVELNKEYKLNFDVVQECTHHGPYLEKPTMFIEIGSSLEQWKNKIAGKIIVETIFSIISTSPEKCKIAFGIGGLHTTPNFKKLLYKGIAVGHVCPKYMLRYLDKDLILQAIKKTHPKNDLIVLDWKGLKQHKQKIVAMLNELNLDYKRIDKL